MADKEVNKVIYGDDTLIDLTEDTVTEDTLAKGVTAHNAAGLAIEGTFEDAIQHIKVNGTEQPIEDNTVDIDVPTKVSELDNDADYVDGIALQEVREVAERAAGDADGAWNTADQARETANNAVQSVKVGTIDTGTANVVNSGTDKDVVFDFTFPEGGGVSAETFSLSGCSFGDWTIRSFTVPVDGTPVGVVGAWADNSNCFLGDFQLNDGSVAVKGFSDGNQGGVTIYVTVLYA